MAPRNSRGKAKNEKKKKEEKVLPVVLDITVNLPDDTRVILKGISTDRIIDVRRLLSVNTETCSITNFSLSHEIRGPRLKDAVDVAALKPCVLSLTEEDYDEGGAAAHVRRVLDIVACTTSFGPCGFDAGKNVPDSKSAKKTTAKNEKDKQSQPPSSPQSKNSKSSNDVTVDGDGEMSHAFPKLSSFYEFFSLSHLTPPLQFIRKAPKRRVKLCNGKMVNVEACRKGFYSVGKQRILCHNIVDLLGQLSRAFDNAYNELMKAFSERNKFGNLPYGFRANTWLIPPIAAQSPSVFPPLPAEDEAWGGNGGGLGRDGKSDLIPWANEFLFVASMPCKTAEERQIRDRKAFLLHNLFVDVAIFRAIKAVHHVMGKPELIYPSNCKILYTEIIGDLRIAIMKDASNACCKVDTKIDGSQATGVDKNNLVERNLLKGITADENTAAHDVATLGVVNVRYCGYIAVVKVQERENKKVGPLFQSIELEQPEGGANALNINSLRLLLHETTTLEDNKPAPNLQNLEREELNASQMFVERLLEESIAKLEEEKPEREHFVRWELGACWIQHLQDQKNAEKDKKLSKEKAKKLSNEKAKSEMKVEGLGTPLKSLKNNRKKSEGSNHKIHSETLKSQADGVNGESEKATSASIEARLESRDKENELALKNLLSDEAFARLKESETGLHCKSLEELIDLSHNYYVEVALPKLVTDFGSLELSPVDGRTLTDFMHTRGLQMRSLGHVVKLSEKLSHVQSLCIHEMIVRAFKHIIQAVISAVGNTQRMAVSIAAALNLMLGVHESDGLNKSHNVHPLVWRWLELFLMKRYEWDLNGLNFKDVRKFAILRGLCHKVGIELVSRDFDMDSPSPFRKIDVVSLVPVHKALAKLVAVCGPYHRMTAGAYSLLAVVLYHTGDFNQATIYQQKALDINERELGLDHPDTMKSYGDLAVFYYRLQHTELALKYVKRALYLLHLTCGPSHPNTAATYINVAMMEEGLGNVHVALRYLHKALKCNQRLLDSSKLPCMSMHFHMWRLTFDCSGMNKTTCRFFEQSWAQMICVTVYRIYLTTLIQRRNVSTLKRKTYVAKVKGNFYQDNNLTSPDGSSKEVLRESSDEETHAPEPESDTDVNQGSSIPFQQQELVVEESAVEKPNITEEISSAIHEEGDDGWQPVQRLRSAGSYGRRLKQRRATIGKVHSYQKRNADAVIDYSSAKSSHHSSRYYLLKKRAVSHGSSADHHPVTTFHGTKFGRRVVKAVAYRVKSMPSSAKTGTVEASINGSEPSSSPSESRPASAPNDTSSVKNSIISLGKSPSYKEVAVAPPGTIAMLQVRVPQSDNPDNQEFSFGKPEDGTMEEKENVDTNVTGAEKINEEKSNSVLDATDNLKEETGVHPNREETHISDGLEDNPSVVVSESERGVGSVVDIHKVVQDGILINGIPNSIDSPTSEFYEKDSSESIESHDNTKSTLQVADDLKEKPSVFNPGDTRGLPNRKLSASAAPFNPSPAVVRASAVAINMTLPPGPGAVTAVAPWPVNMTLHPRPATVLPTVNPMCSSPHQPYPSPPSTPNMMQPLPFMYPPYTQPQGVPTSTFPVTTSAFHHNHFSWQCNGNSNVPEFIPGPFLPGYHPMEFSVPPPVVEPILDPIMRLKAQSGDLDSSCSASILPENIDAVGDAEKEVDLLASKSMDNANEVAGIGRETVRGEFVKENGHLNLCGTKNAGSEPVHFNSQNQSLRRNVEREIEGEKTFSILVRGRRNRKQTLRIPISLLSRPYGSQSFKVVYNRVIRGSEAPKSFSFSSTGDSTATAV
ncbi:hypothetical protein CUMW_091440 [Citrus unshiu]|nr:hypothetical protein CUMW_091440 [Citrus unshiu]GAY45713.1 hypothetical protein CUMW_091440 [Citrus unshiu]GAY45714.1 hypothetical protein CUMW_091440 [Citrus unshiu]GAY45715.1 hypothetical protein CUMW_091440 [Citrus unshiu]